MGFGLIAAVGAHGKQAHRRVDSIWRAQPWTPVPVVHTANIHIADDGPWALIDDPAILNDHWTAADWWKPLSSYDEVDLHSPVDLPYREHLRRLSIFAHAYHTHLAYLQSDTRAFGRGLVSDDLGIRYTSDHLQDSPFNLPAPVYSILTRAELLQPANIATPIFAT